MRTVSYTYVLQKACELTGRVYPPTTEEATMMRSFASMGLRQAWECFDWPEVTVIQKEFFAPDWNRLSTYTAGDVVYWPVEEKYYQYVSNVADPGQAPTYQIGTSSNLALENEFLVQLEDGSYVIAIPARSNTGGTLNSRFWQEAKPSYDNGATEWLETTTYSTVGTIVMYANDRQFYALHTAAPVETLPTDTAYWGLLNPFIRFVNKETTASGAARATDIGEIFAVWHKDPRVTQTQSMVQYRFDSNGLVVEEQIPYAWLEYRQGPPLLTSDPSTIPYRFADIVAYRTAGQMLRVDGKVDLGNEFLLLATSSLTDEIDKVAMQEMQTRQVIVPTR